MYKCDDLYKSQSFKTAWSLRHEIWKENQDKAERVRDIQLQHGRAHRQECVLPRPHDTLLHCGRAHTLPHQHHQQGRGQGGGVRRPILLQEPDKCLEQWEGCQLHWLEEWDGVCEPGRMLLALQWPGSPVSGEWTVMDQANTFIVSIPHDNLNNECHSALLKSIKLIFSWSFWEILQALIF